MPHALLLDLDDTLLNNSMDDFLPRYFQALTAAMADFVEPEPFLMALHKATRTMMQSTDTSRTNEQVFWDAFEPLLPHSREVLEPHLTRFYEEEFPKLAGLTRPVPGGMALVQAAHAAGWKVAIATNPVFPLAAIHHRIEWAGLDADAFDFITSYENMRSTKPHADYFAQIAEVLGAEPSECVMAGNHLANDLVGAAAVGMRTFWTDTHPIADADFTPDSVGSLDDLRRWLFGDEA